MKHIVTVAIFAMIFGLAALAQTSSPGNSQTYPQGTAPSAQPQTSPSQSPDMSNTGNPNSNPAQAKGEKKLKGCIESEGGKYTLEDKHGKEVALGGSQDFASHVGHTVTVHGTYATGSDTTGASATSANSGAGGAGEQFIVTKLDMVSEHCNMDKGKSKDTNTKPNANPQ